MSISVTKSANSDWSKHYADTKQLYSLGKKTHGGGVVHFVEATESFHFVNSETGGVTFYAGLEKSLKTYFWPNKPPPKVYSYKNRGNSGGAGRFKAACASFSNTGLSSLPAPPISGKKLGILVHGEIDSMFKLKGSVSSKLITPAHHALTKAIISKLEEEDLVVIDTEVVCWDPDCMLATKADAICKKNGRIYVVEFKTGSKKNFNYYNSEVKLESGDDHGGPDNHRVMVITDSSRNRACVQASSTCIQYCSTYDIPISKCTPVVIHAPTPDRVTPIYIKQEFIVNTASWIYVETAEERKRFLLSK